MEGSRVWGLGTGVMLLRWLLGKSKCESCEPRTRAPGGTSEVGFISSIVARCVRVRGGVRGPGLAGGGAGGWVGAQGAHFCWPLALGGLTGGAAPGPRSVACVAAPAPHPKRGVADFPLSLPKALPGVRTQRPTERPPRTARATARPAQHAGNASGQAPALLPCRPAPHPRPPSLPPRAPGRPALPLHQSTRSAGGCSRSAWSPRSPAPRGPHRPACGPARLRGRGRGGDERGSGGQAGPNAHMHALVCACVRACVCARAHVRACGGEKLRGCRDVILAHMVTPVVSDGALPHVCSRQPHACMPRQSARTRVQATCR